jgi:hypothetical protein
LWWLSTPGRPEVLLSATFSLQEKGNRAMDTHYLETLERNTLHLPLACLTRQTVKMDLPKTRRALIQAMDIYLKEITDPYEKS